MPKFAGKIGFAIIEEAAPDVHEEKIVERTYYGDMLLNKYTSESSDGALDNVNLQNTVSIVADPFASNNFPSIRYVVYLGVQWKVRSVTVNQPRLEISLGGLYNDKQGAANRIR